MSENTKYEIEKCINSDNWQRIVNQTKHDIELELADFYQRKYKKRGRKNQHCCYLYSADGELVHEFDSTLDLARYWNINISCVYRSLKRREINNGLLVTDEVLTADVAKSIYRQQLTLGRIKDGNGRRKMPIYTYSDNGELVGCFDSIATFKKHGGRWITNDKIINNRLASKILYNQETARNRYLELSNIH